MVDARERRERRGLEGVIRACREGVLLALVSAHVSRLNPVSKELMSSLFPISVVQAVPADKGLKLRPCRGGEVIAVVFLLTTTSPTSLRPLLRLVGSLASDELTIRWCILEFPLPLQYASVTGKLECVPGPKYA